MIERFFIEQNMKKIELENYVKSQLGPAGFTNLEIVKTPLVTRIVLHVVRPGLAIGKGGTTINQLTQEIGKKFGIENPQIEIQEIKNPELDAKANVDKIVSLLERGYSWRSITFKAMQEIMNAKAQGAELILSGKLAGKGGRKRRVRIAQGYIKKVGNQVNLVDFAKATAYPKPGAIGIKLRIIHPGVEFPDKTDIRKFIEKEKEAVAPETVQAAEKEVSAIEVETAKKEISEAKEKTEAVVETAKPVSKTAKKRTAKKAKEKKAVEKAESKPEEKKEPEKKTHPENKKKAKAAE
ncbi:MAG: 30S ribosomal protein S3 [Candidatus ainarchaeum sp.]|nr:30S ribosomal protein S3 [Candidatus ainarchaeum sp.]